MLILSLCGSIALVFALYTVVDGTSAAISTAAFTLSTATLEFAGIHMVRIIDQPTTPTASRAMRLYLLAFTVGASVIAVAVSRDVFLSTKPVAFSAMGLAGAVLAFDVGFIILCAWIVQVRRAHRAKT